MSFIAGGKGEERCGVSASVFENWMRMMDRKGGVAEVEGEELGMLSQAYGWSVGRGVWLTRFEWDIEILGKAVGEWVESEGKENVIGEERYNRMFDILGDCAAAVMGTQKLDDVDGVFWNIEERKRRRGFAR